MDIECIYIDVMLLFSLLQYFPEDGIRIIGNALHTHLAGKIDSKLMKINGKKCYLIWMNVSIVCVC